MHPNSPTFEFLNHLIQRANIKRIICVGDNVAKSLFGIEPHVEIVQFGAHASSPKWVRSEADEDSVKQVRFIKTNLEKPFLIDQALLEDAIVVCFDVLDQLQNPNPLINTLATVRQHCKFMLITVADRARTTGFTFSESSGNTCSHLKWSAEEFFQSLVKAGFPQSMLFGFTSHSVGVEPKNSILVVAGLEAEPMVLPGDFRVAAIINVFNEVDIIETTVRYLADQGIDVHVVDNWSDDGSFELCQRLLDQKLVANLSRFPAQKTNDYEWAKQLEHTAEYAAQLNADWVIHYDADEIRCSPWPSLNLASSIRFVDALGYTAIDFTVLDFRFTDENDVGSFSPSEFNFFEFGRHSSYFTQIKAWKNWHQLVELAGSGGHEAVFVEQRVYPIKFLIKHYSLRSKKQAARKIFLERLPRIAKERAERGWHVHLDQYRYLQSIEPWKPSELTFYDETTFQYEFLVERLSGVGVWRESCLGLNEKTAEHLGRVVAELDGRLSQAVAERDGQIANLHQAVAERDSQIASLNQTVPEGIRQIASLHRAVVERDGQIGRLNQAVAERDGRIGRLNQVVAERDGQIGRLSQVVAERDEQIGRLNQAVNDIWNSTSWRLTAPLRWLNKNFTQAGHGVWGGGYAAPQMKSSQGRQALAKATGESNAFAGEDSSKFRILLVSQYCPTRAHAGGLRLLDVYALIRRHCPSVQVDLFTFSRPSIDWALDDVRRIFHKVYLSPVETLTPEVLCGLRGLPLRYDVVDLQFHQSGYQIDAFRRIGAKVIFTPMESLARAAFVNLRTNLLAANGSQLLKMVASLRVAADEVGFALQADEVVCVSGSDAAFLRAITCSRRVRWVDTGVSQFEFAEALAPSFVCPPAGKRRCNVFYIAYFGSETNVVALRWYLDNVHPIVKASVPDYVFTVVGRGDLAAFSSYRDSSIELVGEVAAIAPCIQEARVGIAPAVTGSGFRGKVNQYSILGVPSVVSAIAHKGLAYQDGKSVFIAEKPEIFADRCIRLLTDLELNDRMGQAAREVCLANYSWESKWPTIREIYNLDKEEA